MANRLNAGRRLSRCSSYFGFPGTSKEHGFFRDRRLCLHLDSLVGEPGWGEGLKWPPALTACKDGVMSDSVGSTAYEHETGPKSTRAEKRKLEISEWSLLTLALVVILLLTGGIFSFAFAE